MKVMQVNKTQDRLWGSRLVAMGLRPIDVAVMTLGQHNEVFDEGRHPLMC